MLKSSSVTVAVFKERCESLIKVFKEFLALDNGDEFSDEEESRLDMFLEINRISSTQRGVSSTPPLFCKKQVT